LVIDNGQVGFLKECYRYDAVFMPLELNPLQKTRAKQYIELRDTYHQLYNYEATELKENAELRQSLNELYNDFLRRFGNLNDRKNLEIIKMDSGGREILSLERAIEGKLVKVDIFTQPVAFNPNEIKQADTSIEVLSASLNKFGEVNLDYMLSLMPEKSVEEMLHDLHGRIYYNPLIREYEVSDKFIAGNVIEKAEALERYLKDNPQSEYRLETAESLKALPVPSPPVMPNKLPCVPSGTSLIDISTSDFIGGLAKSISHGLRIAIVSLYKLSRNSMKSCMKFSRVFPSLK